MANADARGAVPLWRPARKGRSRGISASSRFAPQREATGEPSDGGAGVVAHRGVRALGTMCIEGGQGIASMLERLNGAAGADRTSPGMSP